MIIRQKNVKSIPDGGAKALTEQSKKGDLTLKIIKDGKERYLHSKYDPVMESLRQTQKVDMNHKDLFLVFGAGLGYHIQNLFERLEYGQIIIVVEPEPTLATLFIQRKENQHILDSGQVHLLLMEEGLLHEELAAFITIENMKLGLEIFALGAYKEIFTNKYNYLIQTVNTLKGPVEAANYSIGKMGYIWQQNIMRNFHFLAQQSKPVAALFHKFKAYPAIIVSAGPSLSKNIQLLKEIKENALIISTDTAYTSLRQQGIKPHLLVSVSGNPAAYNKLSSVDYNDIPLVYKPASCADITNNHQGVKFLAVDMDEFLTEGLKKVNFRFGELESGGSVSCSAFDLARKMGCSPIVLIGQDLAYTGGKTHSENSYGYKGVEKEEQAHIVVVKDINGNDIKTSEKFIIFKRWFEAQIARYPSEKRYINATEGGISIKGAKNRPLHEVIDNFQTTRQDASEKIISCCHRADKMTLRQMQQLADYYKNGINQMEKAVALLKKWILEPDYISQPPISEIESKWKGLMELVLPVKFGVLALEMQILKNNGKRDAQYYTQLYEAAARYIESQIELIKECFDLLHKEG